MVVMAYTNKAKPRLTNLKMTVIYSDVYAWAKLIAEKMNGVVRADEFYSLAEDCIIEQTPKMARCIRGTGPNYLYKKIPELARICFAEYPEFIQEVERISREKDQQIKEALDADPILRAICA
ncbi:hypothetical protein JW977_02665 [Candidatus Falkowbacteria bacterium]|nr:hypothetical protein [Candidatus Falkowbacteria bacterium]